MSILSRIFTKKQPPAAHTATRAYAAAEMGRLTADWILSGVAPRDEIFSSIRTIRLRARALERDNDHVRKFLRQVTDNIVGRGFTFQSTIKNPDGTYDERANALIEKSWRDWSELGVCTVDGRKSWADLERLAIRGIARDGEFIVRMHPGWQGNAWRFALQVIDPELLDESYNNWMDVGEGSNIIIMGIEMDQWLRPVAYYFRRSLRDATRVRVPASEIIHMFMEEVEGQIRAVSWMSSAMIRLHHLAGYEEASIVAARGGACKMGFFTTPAGEDYRPQDYADPTILGYRKPSSEATPGLFEELPPGMEFTQYDPAHPQTQFGDYCQSQLRGIASGLGVAYHTFANDLTQVNFSSGRLGTLDERDMWMVFQDWFSTHLHKIVFSNWLRFAMLSNQVPLPYTKLDKFNAPSFQGRRWKWVDPKKDVEAHVIEVERGWLDDMSICDEMGRDFLEVQQRQNQADKIRKKYQGDKDVRTPDN